MKRIAAITVALVVVLAIGGCSAGTAGETDPPQAMPSCTPTPLPTETLASTPSSEPGYEDPGTDDPAQGDPEPVVHADVDLASPTILKRTVTQDVAVRVQASSVVRFSPRVFELASGSVSVVLHLIGDYGYYDGPMSFWLAPGTWTPATGCGATPTGAVAPSSWNMAIGSVGGGDDFDISLTFKPTTDGPWYFVTAIGEPSTCSVGAWTVPANGASR